MALHIISSSPGHTGNFALGITIAGQQDAILLVGNAVYAAMINNTNSHLLESAPCPVYALADDLVARGIDLSNTLVATVIDYPKWVNLSAQHEQSISWFE